MKKATILIALACLFAATPGYAQWNKVEKELRKAIPQGAKSSVRSLRGHDFNISANAVFGQFFRKDTYANYYTLNGTYTYRMPFERWFQFGGGLGVGNGTFLNYSDGEPVDYHRENAFTMQVYGRAKFNFSDQYETAFALIDIGYAYAGQEKPNTDKNYNALGFYFQPAVGYDFNTKWTRCISVMLGCNFGLQKYYTVSADDGGAKASATNKLRASMVLGVGYTF